MVTNTDEVGQSFKIDNGKIVAYLKKYVTHLTRNETAHYEFLISLLA
jgi:hypothetical protein